MEVTMKIRKYFGLLTLAASLVGLIATAALARDELKDVKDSTNVLKKIMQIPEKGIPPALLRDAQGIVIVPNVIKGAFIVGGRHGTGVLLVREENGGWSDPVFVSLTGGSIGWQVGGTSTDVILVFKNRKGIEGLLKGKFTLGADAAVAAGPVGRSAEAATDVMLKSEILSYSRSRGLFAGVSLEGAALMVDEDATDYYYGKKGLHASDILAGKGGKGAPATRNLKQLLAHYSSMK
jgi:lipid-binding SYLF domain-containing protein